MYIEFVGPPGSGKSFFFEKLSRFLKKKKILFETPKEVFFNIYLKKKTRSIKIRKFLYRYYCKYINPYSNYLFKKETKDLKFFIQKEINSSKRIKILVNAYCNYMKGRLLPEALLKRMIFNFKVDCIGTIKKENNDKILVSEEGFYQKFYLNFKTKKKKGKFRGNLSKIFNNFKNPKIIFFFNCDIKNSIIRTRKRKTGFKYYINKRFILDDKHYFDENLVKIAKKKKIKVLNVYSNKKMIENFNENFARWLF